MLFCLLPFAALMLRAEGRRGGTVVGNKNIGHALDNDKWLSTVSQYDKDRYWNKFRDVSLELPCFSQLCFQMGYFGYCWIWPRGLLPLQYLVMVGLFD